MLRDFCSPQQNTKNKDRTVVLHVNLLRLWDLVWWDQLFFNRNCEKGRSNKKILGSIVQIHNEQSKLRNEWLYVFVTHLLNLQTTLPGC